VTTEEHPETCEAGWLMEERDGLEVAVGPCPVCNPRAAKSDETEDDDDADPGPKPEPEPLAPWWGDR